MSSLCLPTDPVASGAAQRAAAAAASVEPGTIEHVAVVRIGERRWRVLRLLPAARGGILDDRMRVARPDPGEWEDAASAGRAALAAVRAGRLQGRPARLLAGLWSLGDDALVRPLDAMSAAGWA